MHYNMLYNDDMAMKKILAQVRKADSMFHLIEDKDKIAIGLSGGKDSSLLLYTMYLYRFLYENTYHKSFELYGIHIDLNFGEDDMTPLFDWFKQYDLNIYHEDSKIADILKLNLHKEKIDCSLCSTLKKGYGGRIATFDPKMYLDHSDTTFIRPFCLSFESDIAKTCRQLEIPIISSGCPNDGYTKRADIKKMLHSLYHEYPQAKENFLLSLYNREKLNLYFKNMD